MAVTIDQAGEDWNPDEQLCVVRPSPSSCLHLVSVAGDLEAPHICGNCWVSQEKGRQPGREAPWGAPHGLSRGDQQGTGSDSTAKISWGSQTNWGTSHLARTAAEA